MDRREFLKLSSLFLLSQYIPSIYTKSPRLERHGDQPNILIVLFDTLSAAHVPLHGYSRETTPHLARIADKAFVYHNHFAGGSWTFPSTASFLTGVYPWNHKAYRKTDLVVSPYKEANLFSLFPDYFRIAYTHNPAAENVLKQFWDSMDTYLPIQSLFVNKQKLLSFLFGDDAEMASVSWDRIIKKGGENTVSSLFLSNLYQLNKRFNPVDFGDEFPVGPPNTGDGNYFFLEEAIDWIQDQSLNLPQPYLSYFHLLPPHDPYAPRREYFNAFDGDGFKPANKPSHFFKMKKLASGLLLKMQQTYDEFILNVDAEIGRLFDFLENQGVLENTIVIFTSDHGEMFERGIRGHREATFHQPIIRVPLMIFTPGNHSRKDIYEPTVAVDILPTLLHLSKKSIPDSFDGLVLPPFQAATRPTERNIYAVDAQQRQRVVAFPLSLSTTMLLQYPYKLSYYTGYEELPDGKPAFELYDLDDDPEEMNNIYSKNLPLAKHMADELLTLVNEKNTRKP